MVHLIFVYIYHAFYRTDSILRGFPTSNSLPRHISIWQSGQANKESIIREGQLGRTKITENGKKVRKNWGIVWAVLTDSHLSLFKDQKTFSVRYYCTQEYKATNL